MTSAWFLWATVILYFGAAIAIYGDSFSGLHGALEI
jgi:hypothetical protein